VVKETDRKVAPSKTTKEKPPPASSSSSEFKKYVSPPSSPESSSDDDEPEIWPVQRMNELKALVLKRHEASRNYHSSAGPDARGLDNYDEHKYYVLMRHIDTLYDGKLGSHKDLFPPTPAQVDELISWVVHECKPCSNLRRLRIKMHLETEKEVARRRQDWSTRYQHRLQEEEYDTDEDHVADSKCYKCKLSAGRKHMIGKVHGDASDLDQLYNCEGADCTRAFHRDCRPGLEQDTPESRRARGLDPSVPLSFGRRREPWLCPECWKTAGRKQLEHERKALNEDKQKFLASKASSKKPKSNPSDGRTTPVNPDFCPSSAPSDEEEARENGAAATSRAEKPSQTPTFLQILQGAMRKKLPTDSNILLKNKGTSGSLTERLEEARNAGADFVQICSRYWWWEKSRSWSKYFDFCDK
jgi:hypothetical protein